MPAPDELTQFLAEIESDITAEASNTLGSGLAHFREEVFTQQLAHELEEEGILEDPVACFHESGRGSGLVKVNGYGIPEEENRLDLIISIYGYNGNQVETINASDVDTAFNRLERFLARASAGLGDEVDPSTDAWSMVDLISRMEPKIDRVCFHLFTNARLSQRREKQRKVREGNDYDATYEVWDLERFRRLREGGVRAEPLNVDLRSQPTGGLPCVRMEAGEFGDQTCITLFPGQVLGDLYNEHGSRLLELNVRSYLQAKGKVNKGILKTLREAPVDFLSYNNGITVVADTMLLGPLADGTPGILELRNMQIVNGGQTTASIHRAAKDYKTDLSKVFVLGKITVVDPSRFQEVVPLISRYSNTQNRVTEADLSANHQFHVSLERASRREWTPDQRSMWFYERARGSFQTAKNIEGSTPAERKRFELRYPTSQRFTKEDLARFEMAWMGYPYIVSKGAQKCYVQFMQRLEPVPDDWVPETELYRRYVAKGILFREAQRIVRSEKSITAYQINVSAYLVALLSEKTARRIDLDWIWTHQTISDVVRKTLENWAPVVFRRLPEYAQIQGRHIGESFKSEGCWQYMENLPEFAVPVELEPELISVANGEPWKKRVGRPRRPLSSHDQNNVARCSELKAEEWLAIADWGQQTNRLASWQRGLARTLASYAAEGWSKLPSQKQARYGVEMLQAARDEGVLDKAR
jgi:hypothetical protein